MNFLTEIGTEEVLLGGSYLEKCVSGFYKHIESQTDIKFYLVPELVQLYPGNISNSLTYKLFNQEGKIDENVLLKSIREIIVNEKYSEYLEVKNLGG